MRPLSLHVSALNDAEYDLYTTSLIDLAASGDGNEAQKLGRNDEYFDQLTVGVREARAWLKGRFSHIPGSQIDEILKFFSPNMSPSDTLSGGQFFAALRLTLHVESGKQVDRGLAFAQAFPRPAPPQAPPASPPKRQLPIPPSSAPMMSTNSTNNNPFSHPPMLPTSHSNPFNPFTSHSQSHPSHRPDAPPPQKIPPLPPRKPSLHQPPPRHASQLPAVKPVHVTSPLMRQSLQASKVGQSMKKAEEQLEKERILQVLKSSNTRNRSISPSKLPPRPPPRPGSSSGSGSEPAMPSSSVPPLPQRRTASPSMSTISLDQVALARPNINTDVGQSYGSSPFKTPDQAFREPPNFSLARSPSTSPTRSTTSTSNKDLPPPKHPRRKPPPPIDSAYVSSTSTSSALSSADSTTLSTPFRDRDRAESPLPPVPTDDSPTARVFRSKSVHYPSPPPPPVPPPLGKRRPESVQILGGLKDYENSSRSPSSPFGNRGPRSEGGTSNGSNGSGTGLSRHVSMSATTPSPKGSYYRRNGTENNTAHHPFDRDTTPLGNFQRTLATFQPKLDALQPKLEKVRYKAEAGLSKRGFVRGDGYRRREGEDEEGLMDGGGGGGRYDYDGWDRVGGMDGGGPDVDSGDESGAAIDDRERERGRKLNGPRNPLGGREVSVEKDNLKLPPGEGWKPL